MQVAPPAWCSASCRPLPFVRGASTRACRFQRVGSHGGTPFNGQGSRQPHRWADGQRPRGYCSGSNVCSMVCGIPVARRSAPRPRGAETRSATSFRRNLPVCTATGAQTGCRCGPQARRAGGKYETPLTAAGPRARPAKACCCSYRQRWPFSSTQGRGGRRTTRGS